MKVELIGGPCDGAQVEVTDTRFLMVPKMTGEYETSDKFVWSDGSPVVTPVVKSIVYERGEDGKYRYRETRG